MLCPAAVSAAAAAAVWLLAVLGRGLSVPAEDNSEPGFSLCSHCFYRQTPPQGGSAGPLLRPLCHRLPGGQAFATLSRPTCDTAVYSAFRLSHGGPATEGEEGGEHTVEEEEEGKIKPSVPALLRGGRGTSHPVSPSDSPLQHWDSTVTTLVQSSISPQCSDSGGDLYILMGAGGLGAAEGKCQVKPLWSAMCCAVPEGKNGFSVGLIREAGEAGRQVSMQELEEMLGVAELFSEGCGGVDGKTIEITVDAAGEVTEEEDGSDATSQSSNKVAGDDALSEEADVAQITQETSADAAPSESGGVGQDDVTRSRAVRSEFPETSAEHETVDGQETDANSSSIVVFVLSTTLSILTAPMRPVFSTITQLPGQVTYVLQEDLGVLSALPGDTFSLLHLLTSDLFSWMGSAADMVLDIGETSFCSMYYCISSMLGALVNSCYTGVTGMGTLAGDTVGIFGDALDNGWWVTKFFGGRLWEQGEGYVGTVMSEMGGQAKAVGGGLGRLAWRSGNGVGNVFRVGGGVIMGMVDMVIGGVREAFGQESE